MLSWIILCFKHTGNVHFIICLFLLTTSFHFYGLCLILLPAHSRCIPVLLPVLYPLFLWSFFRMLQLNSTFDFFFPFICLKDELPWNFICLVHSTVLVIYLIILISVKYYRWIVNDCFYTPSFLIHYSEDIFKACCK